MKPSIALERHRDAIRKIVARHRAANARVIGEGAFHALVTENISYDAIDKRTFSELVAEMAAADLRAAERNQLCQNEGYEVMQGHE